MALVPENPPIDPVVLESLQRGFEQAVPGIEKHARIFFRDLDVEKREDRVEDVLALAWKYYLRLHETGKNPDDFLGPMADFTAKQVRLGRRLTGQLSPRDASSEYAQVRKRFYVGRLPAKDTSLEENELFVALTDNRRMSPADGAAFHIDYEDWLSRMTPERRAIAEDKAAGWKNGELAKKYGKTPGRISQIGAEDAMSWAKFHGEEPSR